MADPVFLIWNIKAWDTGLKITNFEACMLRALITAQTELGDNNAPLPPTTFSPEC